MTLSALSRCQDYALPAGTCDVRGWGVRTLVDGAKVGEVHDLLLDPADAPRYLDVALGFLQRHVLLPIGQARADTRSRIVWVPGMSREQLRSIPAYEHDLAEITRTYETGLLAAYRSVYAGRDYRPRPPYTGTVYGPSELEDRLVSNRPPRIAPISELEEFRIPDPEIDPRGWTIIMNDGIRIGSVDELLVDTEALKVRYLVCDVDEEGLGLDEQDRHVIVPVGFARLDEDNRNVLVDGFGSEEVRRLPVYTGAEVDDSLSRELGAGGEGGDAFYTQPQFDARSFFGSETE